MDFYKTATLPLSCGKCLFIPQERTRILNPAHVRLSVIVAFRIFPPWRSGLGEKKSLYLMETIHYAA